MGRRTPVIAGNWKMNKGPLETSRFFEAFQAAYAARADRTIIFFPSAIAVSAAIDAVARRPDLLVGVQSIHWEPAGAFTGEISAPMAAEAGARVVLAGHSERRHVFGESDEQVGRKVVAALSAGLDVMVCVGETLDERRAGHLEAVLERQISTALSAIAADHAPHVSLAYEPVWAIGTGVTATPDDAAAAHALVRDLVTSRFGGDAGGTVPILYGGSVNAANAASLLDAPGVDGLLVGGASLKPDSFATIAATD